MNALIEQHRKSIEDLCRKYHVRRLELFGSATREDFKVAESDLDFLVERRLVSRDLAKGSG